MEVGHRCCVTRSYHQDGGGFPAQYDRDPISPSSIKTHLWFSVAGAFEGHGKACNSERRCIHS